MTIYLAATVEEGGRVTVNNLPLQPGQKVQMTIVAIENPTEVDARYPLRGSVYRYIDPDQPAIDPDDWEANQ